MPGRGAKPGGSLELPPPSPSGAPFAAPSSSAPSSAAPPPPPPPPLPPLRDSPDESGGSSNSSYNPSPSSTSTTWTDNTTDHSVSPQASAAASHFSVSAVLHDLAPFPSDSFGLATASQVAAATLKGEKARSLLRICDLLCQCFHSKRYKILVYELILFTLRFTRTAATSKTINHTFDVIFGETQQMLLRHPKSSTESAVCVPPDIHNLIPCGDVAGLLAVNVKLCKDFTPKLVVKRDTYLLVRISIDKIMKCTNPQIYRANVRSSSQVNFGDTKYFSLKVPAQKSDPRNKITLELVGFEGPKDFPRLFGNMSVHLYEVIQKQSFTQVYAMRIRNMVFCTAEVEFMFCYGCLGYGYSHQLKLPGADPAKAVAYSMFLRVPPPENRKDRARNVIKPQRMDYPAFLSPDLNVIIGNAELDVPAESSEEYRSLQNALKQPPRERLERMKNEYRSLKTWQEKADYLDQLILKRGPKIKPVQPKGSRFRELVGRMQRPSFQRSQISTERIEKEDKVIETQPSKTQPPDIRPPDTPPPDIPPPEAQPPESQKWEELSDAASLLPTSQPTSEPESEGETLASGGELARVRSSSLPDEAPQPVPTVTVTFDTASSTESLEAKGTSERGDPRGEMAQESETSLSSSSGIPAEFSESGDLEGPEGQERPPSIARIASLTEYLLEPAEEPPAEPEVPETVSDEFVAPKPSESLLEPVQEWHWKDTGFKDAVFSGNKFEPFLRRVCREPPPPFRKCISEVFSFLEETHPSDDMKEQEDQDPPDGLPVTKRDTLSDNRLIKSGEQLSILRLIERKMDLEEEDQTIVTPAKTESKLQAISSGIFQKPPGEKLSEAEIEQAQIYFKKSLEDFLVDKLVKIVAVKSLLSQNIENLVAERFSEAELSQEREDSSSPDGKEKGFLPGSSSSSVETFTEPYMKELKESVSLTGELSEQGMIPLTEKDQKKSLQSSGDLLKRRKRLSREKFSQAERATMTSFSDIRLGSASKGGPVRHTKESTKEDQPVVPEAGLSKVDDRKLSSSSKREDSSVEGISTDTKIKREHSTQSLEIIKVTVPFNIKEADSYEPLLSTYDPVLEKVLNVETASLKSFLSKDLQDHLKDKLSETGIASEELETVCQKLSLNGKEREMIPEKGMLQSIQILPKEDLTEKIPILSKSIPNILEALSETERANLNSALSSEVQKQLSERLSKLDSITEKELRKYLESILPVMGKEPSEKKVNGLDSSTAGLTHSLHDRFSEEELQNLKSLLSRLLKEDHQEELSEAEIKGLSSVLQKNFEDLPIQSSSETGISNEVAIKDECCSISLSDVETSLKPSSTEVMPKRGKVRSKESLHKISAAGEKRGLRRESLDHSPLNSVFEVETKSQETQTAFSSKREKCASKKESHRLPGYPNNPSEMSVLKTGPFEAGLKSRPSDEASKKKSEPFAFSSFLSAHDIGTQTEIKKYLSRAADYLPKPPFPVNPQTFLLLHSESEEEAKPVCKHRPKTKTKRKSDKKKDPASGPTHQAGITSVPTKKEKTNNGNAAKEVAREKGKRRGEPSSPRLGVTESRKDTRTAAHPGGGGRKESLKRKPEKKHDTEAKPRKPHSKAAAPPEAHLQNLSKHLAEKLSTTFPAPGHAKVNTLISAGTDDSDPETYKHLEKAVERALLDLGQVAESNSVQGRPNTAPGAAALVPKVASRSSSSVFETPRNQAGLISEMFHGQEQTLNLTPEQLEVVLTVLQKVLKQHAQSQE